MRAEKQLLLDEIQEKLATDNTVLLTRYEKLTADRAGELRRALRETGGEFEVVRKRVLLKAAEVAGLEIDPKVLEGHIALVVTKEDPVAATKAVFQFGKDNEQAIEVLAGRMDGKMYSAADVEKLSKLPDQQTMRAQFLGLLEAPASQTLAVMQALLCSVLYCLEQKASQNQS